MNDQCSHRTCNPTCDYCTDVLDYWMGTDDIDPKLDWDLMVQAYERYIFYEGDSENYENLYN